MKNKLPWNLIKSALLDKLSEGDKVKFDSWLKQEENQQLYTGIKDLWVNVQQKSANYEPDVEFYWNELASRIEKESRVAHTLGVSKGTGRYMPAVRFYRMLAVASVLLILGFSSLFYFVKVDTGLQHSVQTYASLTGKSKVVLPDGSEVWLHSNSTLSYNDFNKNNTREVSMTGEAYFDVKKDAGKPFIVSVNDVKVKVHGTSFNVNAYDKSGQVLVSLFEGNVSMDVAGKQVFLSPGEEGSYDGNIRLLSVKQGDVDFAKSWSNDHLRFENKNLRQVCRYLSKWYTVDIDIDPAIANNQSYTFTLRDESLEEVVRILSRINEIDYQFDENNKLLLKPKILK
ncbi:MAG: FecR domain-containing protein [Paludibacter sp.]|jgi:ferric-dicitrate binding protein FerR (iron transport regulator)|nr:FecR domain-containing protein [Paludibacter sp.]